MVNKQTHNAIAVSGGGERSGLSRAQKVFNTLIRQINTQRVGLAAWEAAIPPYQKKYAEEYLPLTEQLTDLQIQLVHALDKAAERKGITKTERSTMAQLIIDVGGNVVAARNDAEIKAIYNKYSSEDYDSEEAEDLAEMKAMIESMTGVDLGDVEGLDSPEDVLAHLQAQMKKEEAGHAAKQEKHNERKAAKKKSAKQQAKEAAQQEAEQKISQSIREVYRKLASALHPDREPDPAERERKNALMQRANQAYEKNNLLQLLELQLELEHIDQTAIDNLSEERLVYFNRVLKEQLAELKQELLFVEGRFKAQFGIHPFEQLSAARLGHDLDADIADLRQTLTGMEMELGVFDDARALKAWLKAMRQAMQDRARNAFDAPPYW